MKLVTTLLIIAALLIVLAIFANRSFNQYQDSEIPDVDKNTCQSETHDESTNHEDPVIPPVKCKQPRDPKTGKFISKK